MPKKVKKVRQHTPSFSQIQRINAAEKMAHNYALLVHHFWKLNIYANFKSDILP
jgi:hypothetical protein